MKNILNKRLLYFCGAYISFFIFIFCSAMDFEIGSILFKVLTICLLCVYVFEGSKHIIDLEKVILLLFGVILCTFMLIRGKIHGIEIIYVLILWGVTVIYIIQNHFEMHMKEWLGKNWRILLIILTFVLLSLEVIDSWFMWDDRTYYAYPTSDKDVQGMVYNFDTNFAGVDGLYLADHVSLGYSLWLIVFQLIKEGSESVQIANIILAGISIFAYYQVLRKILANRFSDKIILMAVLPYSFSPFVLGMVGNLDLDSATMYFFVIFIACSLYQYEVLEWVLAFFFCFTKETAIIYYGVYILVKVICEYRREQLFQLNTFIKYSFGNIRNYMYALPIVLWGMLKFSKPVWGGATLWRNEGINCFGIDISVIVMKLKQIFLLNFNWIFWGIILGGGITLLLRKFKINKEILIRVIPISAVGVVVIIFGCLYITWTNVRYILPIIPILYLIATLLIAKLECSNCFCSINIILSILLLIQSFYVIDPIMINTFESISVGNGEVYNMQVSDSQRVVAGRTFKDSIVYNRQYIYWQETLIYTLKKSGYDGNMLIVLPNSYNCSEFSLLGQKNGIALWNTQEEKLEYYNENYEIPNNCTWLKVCHIPDADQAYDGNDMLYIIPRWADVDMNFVSNKNVIRQGEVDNKGFNIRYMVMNFDNNLPLNDGRYVISPKQDSTLGLCTKGEDGGVAFLDKDAAPLTLEANNNITYHLNFEEQKVALDVPRGHIDDNGTVQVWSINSTNGQKWTLEKMDDCFMICFKDYALTYNLQDNSIKLLPKTGEDNQLWLFSN